MEFSLLLIKPRFTVWILSKKRHCNVVDGSIFELTWSNSDLPIILRHLNIGVAIAIKKKNIGVAKSNTISKHDTKLVSYELRFNGFVSYSG